MAVMAELSALSSANCSSTNSSLESSLVWSSSSCGGVVEAQFRLFECYSTRIMRIILRIIGRKNGKF